MFYTIFFSPQVNETWYMQVDSRFDEGLKT